MHWNQGTFPHTLLLLSRTLALVAWDARLPLQMLLLILKTCLLFFARNSEKEDYEDRKVCTFAFAFARCTRASASSHHVSSATSTVL